MSKQKLKQQARKEFEEKFSNHLDHIKAIREQIAALKKDARQIRQTQSKTIVQGVEELEKKMVKIVKGNVFFNTSWWETVSTKHIANDIVINTERPIRNIILNGKVIEVL